jgi:hypothetical protein
MTAGLILANLGAALTTLLGCLGLFAPTRAAAFTSISPVGANGISEIRATYGGLFAALGISCLVTQSTPLFLAVGIAWIGAGLGRIWSVVVDRNLDRKNLGGIAMEFAIGSLLFAVQLSAA